MLIGYTCYLFLLGFVIPMLVILVTSLRVKSTMMEHSKRADKAGVVNKARKKEDKVNKTLLIIILAYLICWSPYAVIINKSSSSD